MSFVRARDLLSSTITSNAGNNVSIKIKFLLPGIAAWLVRLLYGRLISLGYQNIVTRTHAELDLTDQAAVREFFQTEKVDRVVLAAAKVGGIHANNIYPADFIYINLMIQANVIHQAFEAGVKNLLFLGSSCIYPKLAPQPMKEDPSSYRNS